MDGDLIQGALQSLLQNREQMSQRQQQAQQQHIQTMQTPLPQTSPIQSMVSDYLQKYAQNPGMAWSAMASAAGGANERSRKIEEDFLLRQQAADAQEAKYAGEALKEEDLFGGRMMVKGALGGKQPTPEQLRTVYTSARNEAAQIAKGYNFESAEQQSAWVEQQANAAVENYIQRFAGQPAGPYGANPPGSRPAAGGAPTQAPMASAVPTQEPIQQQAESRFPTFEPLPEIPGMPKASTQLPSPPARNKPEEERKKVFSTDTEKGAIKDYEENIKPAANMATSMLQTLSVVKQIPRTQDMFAPYREKLGAAMDAIDMDGKIVREAQSLQQLRPILAKIANDRLLLAKGVQTEGDAQRAYNEFVKITDTQKAADFMYAWTEELANRAKFKKQIYDLSAKEKGTMREGEAYWNSTDYAKTSPVAFLNGKPWTYTQWRDAFIKANPVASSSDLIGEWNRLSRGGK